MNHIQALSLVEASKPALEAWEYPGPSWPEGREKAAQALRTAIEQAGKQEPVAAQSRFSGDEWTQCSVEHAKMVMANPHEWKNYEFRLLYTTPPAAPVQEPISDGTEAVTRTVIEVEKLLCEKLGRKWQASGMSIQTLVDELAAQRQWVGLTDEEMYFAIRPLYKTDALANAVVSLSKDEYLAIEAKLRAVNGFSCDATEKNGGQA